MLTSSSRHWYFNSRPHEEVDHFSGSRWIHHANFNSRPHEEVDGKRPIMYWQNTNFNSRPHEEVDGMADIEHTGYNVFQLTTSRRGRRSLESLLILRISFQLTTSRRGRRITNKTYKSTGTFQLTTSRRGRLPCGRWCLPDTAYFNSRPHEEVDKKGVILWGAYIISTHDLTKRSTFGIHRWCITAWRFQLTTSRRGRPVHRPRTH